MKAYCFVNRMDSCDTGGIYLLLEEQDICHFRHSISQSHTPNNHIMQHFWDEKFPVSKHIIFLEKNDGSSFYEKLDVL